MNAVNVMKVLRARQRLCDKASVPTPVTDTELDMLLDRLTHLEAHVLDDGAMCGVFEFRSDTRIQFRPADNPQAAMFARSGRFQLVLGSFESDKNRHGDEFGG